MSWFNPDGLLLKFGTEKATSTTGGEYHNVGQLHEVELKVSLTSVGSTATILNDVYLIPKNARIVEVEILTETGATSGGATTLDVGLIATNRSTEIDFNGLVAAFAKASYDAAGEKNTITLGSTGAGALIGTTTASPGYLCANWNTAAFTAGVLYIKVRYYMT